MAKYDAREGNSCHMHFSLVGDDGSPVFASAGEPAGGDRSDRSGFSPVLEHFLAGQLAGMRELTLLLAPNINSYKRFVEGSFAPTAVRWGHDNRTCALRVVGHGRSLRFENRLPGGDVNPYLAVAAIIAAGLDGIERELPLEPAFVGNAYTSDSETVPTTLRDALSLWEGSALARSAFGSEVVDHYANMARVEIAAFDRADHRLGASSGVRTPVTTTQHEVVNPATEQVLTTVHLADVRETDEAIERASRRLPGLARGRARRPGSAAAALRRRGRRRRRAPRAAGGGQRRSHHRQRPVGGGQRPRRARVLRRRPGAAVRPADPRGGRRRRHLPRAAGRRRGHRPVELPDADRRLGASRPRWRRATPWC